MVVFIYKDQKIPIVQNNLIIFILFFFFFTEKLWFNTSKRGFCPKFVTRSTGRVIFFCSYYVIIKLFECFLFFLFNINFMFFLTLKQNINSSRFQFNPILKIKHNGRYDPTHLPPYFYQYFLHYCQFSISFNNVFVNGYCVSLHVCFQIE